MRDKQYTLFHLWDPLSWGTGEAAMGGAQVIFLMPIYGLSSFDLVLTVVQSVVAKVGRKYNMWFKVWVPKDAPNWSFGKGIFP